MNMGKSVQIEYRPTEYSSQNPVDLAPLLDGDALYLGRVSHQLMISRRRHFLHTSHHVEYTVVT